MKRELIEDLFEKFEQACHVHHDIECWSARELQTILGYTKVEQLPESRPKGKVSL